MISEARFYLKLLTRRLPAMIVLFLLASIAGLVMAQRLPTMYKTSATLLVESAQISNDLVRSTVQVTAAEQLEVIQRRLMTRANLIDIANKFNVFPNGASMSPDEIVSAMREATRIRRVSGRDKATIMTLSFEGRNPRKIQQVVNEYVTIVLSTSSDFRSQRAEGTLNFFDQEVNRLSEKLDEQSAQILAFKAENSDALPDNLTYRLNQQSLWQERLSRAERDLESLAAQRANIRRVYEATGSVGGATERELTPEEKRLKALERQLRSALSIYSAQNPKIRNLRAQIEAQEAEVELQQATLAANNNIDSEQASALDISLAEIDARIETVNQEIDKAVTELVSLEDSIGRTPANGIALTSMERDQNNIQSLYSAAVRNLAQAQMSDRVEGSGAGQRISVLEAARVPNEPSSPNRTKVAAQGVAAGLGLAAGLFLLLEVLNQSIRRPSDITQSLDITPLATLPFIESIAGRRWRRFRQVMVLLIVLAGVPAGLWAVDTHYMPLDLLFEKIKDRLVS